MATTGQFYWPSVGTSVAAYGQFFMAANTGRPGNQPQAKGITMFDAGAVPITRYRWRAHNIPTPWANAA